MEKKGFKDFFTMPNPDKIKEFAEYLINNHAIKVNNNQYTLEEIEVYLYCQGHQDANVYPRDCAAEQFFVHYSGFDIAFQTKNEGKDLIQFGGVLVRSLKKNNTEMIYGPMRCLMEVFNQQEMPMLTHIEQCRNIGVIETHRVGINENANDEKLRFRTDRVKDNDNNYQDLQIAYKKNGIPVMDLKRVYYKPMVE